MSALREQKLLSSVKGHHRPSLGKSRDQITLLDIYKAVEGDKPLLHLDTHTNPECGVGINIQLALQDFFDIVQSNAESGMQSITLLQGYEQKIKNINK